MSGHKALPNQAADGRIVILDFGSQYTQLIARRIREQNVYSEVHPYNTDVSEVLADDVKGIVLSGGPSNISSEDALLPDRRVLESSIPILGICYGMQLIVEAFGGRICRAERHEYGSADLSILEAKGLFKGIPDAGGSETPVWMSHGDGVDKLPPGFVAIGRTPNSPFAAIKHSSRPIVGVQFHPEVAHTPEGRGMLHNFLFEICKCKPTWTAGSFVEEQTKFIRELVGDGKVLCADDHPYPAGANQTGTQDNKATAVLSHDAFGAASEAMLTFKDPRGNPMMVPPGVCPG